MFHAGHQSTADGSVELVTVENLHPRRRVQVTTVGNGFGRHLHTSRTRPRHGQLAAEYLRLSVPATPDVHRLSVGVGQGRPDRDLAHVGAARGPSVRLAERVHCVTTHHVLT